MGDGAMAQFSTALDAVNCSIEIQEVARAKLDGKLRIEIHSGDITIISVLLLKSIANDPFTSGISNKRSSEFGLSASPLTFIPWGESRIGFTNATSPAIRSISFTPKGKYEITNTHGYIE